MVTDAYDLSQLTLDGTIREDIMDTLFDISDIPLPFTSRVGTSRHSAPKAEWTVDRLQAPVDNAVIDGDVTLSDQSYSSPESRIGNTSQISRKVVYVSHRASAVDTVSYARELAKQVSRRGNELRRDVERACLLNNANVIDTGAGGVPGEAAGLEAWLDDEDEAQTTIYDATGGNASSYRDLTTGGITSIGGWTNQSGGIIPAIDYTGYTANAALTEQAVKDVIEQLYINGADPTVIMTRPAVVRRWSEFQFSSESRVATLTNQDGAASRAQRVAQASVNIFVSDFSVLEVVPNRLMAQSNGGNSDTLFIFDPNYLAISYLEGYRTDQLAKVGLQDRRMISVDWTLKVLAWTSLGGIIGIDDAAAVTAS